MADPTGLKAAEAANQFGRKAVTSEIGADLAGGGSDPNSEIARRKSQHVEIVRQGGVSPFEVTTGFDRFRFEHCALPELDLDEIDLSTTFLGRRMKAPLIISCMTGGPLHAHRINKSIAQAAGRCGIGFGVGSQRIALEGNGAAGFSRSLRQWSGDVPILANCGAAQLKTWNGLEMARRAVHMIDADALVIHLNPLQEAVQQGGDRHWSGILRKIEAVALGLEKPVIVKEVGCGISANVAKQLWDAGVKIIDVAGAGGTSWAAVEAARATTPYARAIAEPFREWGIPTAASIALARKACPTATLVASGGIRNGIDAAKAIRLGADIVGQAAATLAPALDTADALTQHIEILIAQLRIACLCTSSRNLVALKTASISANTN